MVSGSHNINIIVRIFPIFLICCSTCVHLSPQAKEVEKIHKSPKFSLPIKAITDEILISLILFKLRINSTLLSESSILP